MSPALEDALTSAPWTSERRAPAAVELERWLAAQRPSVRVEYLALLLTRLATKTSDSVAEPERSTNVAAATGVGAHPDLDVAAAGFAETAVAFPVFGAYAVGSADATGVGRHGSERTPETDPSQSTAPTTNPDTEETR